MENVTYLITFFTFLIIWRVEGHFLKPLGVENASTVVENILRGYKDEIGPTLNGEPVHVKVQILINDMMPLTQADNHFSADFYLRMQWFDRRLRFPAESDEMFIPFEEKFAKEIWTPSLYFPNGKGGMKHQLTKTNVFVKVQANGSVYYSERMSVISFCQMNMTFYPFDIQRCNMSMEDYSNPVEYMRLEWDTPAVTQDSEILFSKDFERIELEESNTTRIGDFDHSFDKLRIQFTLYRDIKLYVLRDFLPCILIVMMSWITFWISYKSIPARVCLGITTVLTTVSMTNSVQKANPVSSTLRSLDVFLLICLLFVFGALLELAITGMADPNGSSWWKTEMKKEKSAAMECEESTAAVGEENNATAEGSGSGTPGLAGIFKLPLRLRKVFPAPQGDEGMSVTKRRENVRFIGPFVFPRGEKHIVDQYAKIFFPTAYFLFLLIFFLFHHFHPETVGGSNSADE